MEFSKYISLLKQIRFGKRLPEALYVHRCGLEELPNELVAFIQAELAKMQLTTMAFDLLKFHLREFKFSLLAYPTFWNETYPELKSSCTVDLISKRVKMSSYEKSDNPPILHRKETFLPPNHPRVSEYAKLTQEAEAAGLFENLHTIGFKQNWLKQIKKKGYLLKDGHLEKLPICGERTKSTSNPNTENNISIPIPAQIHRHRTAINRNILSSPMQSLFNHGYLDGQHTVFDFGCGKGDDVRELQAHGVSATGWDPVFKADEKKRPADIVNLGFVINVIERPDERHLTLREAFSLARKVLAVSVMLGGEAITSKFRTYGDGVVTSRGTFQKYYTQQEIRSFIEGSLEKNAVAVGPGLFFVFPNPDDEQIFLAERQRRQFDWVKLSQREEKNRMPIERANRLEKNQALIEDFKNACLSLGRLCKPDEFEFSVEVRKVFGSLPKAWEHLVVSEPELFQKARQARIEDLLVYFGLNLFGKRKPYVHMPKSMQRDVQEFFGDYKKTQEQARELLFSVGTTQKIHQACVEANKEGIGYLDEAHSLQLHTSQIKSLPAILRLYVGCATQLFGDVEKADLVKIHIQSGKVSLMLYDDFENKPLPRLLERIKIKLREQQIDFFDYSNSSTEAILFQKGRFISPGFPYYLQQQEFDKQIEALQLFDFSGYGPSKKVFEEKLKEANLAVQGFQIVNSSPKK